VLDRTAPRSRSYMSKWRWMEIVATRLDLPVPGGPWMRSSPCAPRALVILLLA
jgi:hypothetical protein